MKLKRILLTIAITLCLSSGCAYAQRVNPYILGLGVQEYYIETKVFLVDQEVFDKLTVFYFGVEKVRKILAFTITYSNGTKNVIREMYVVAQYGIWNEPSSEDLGHELKHIIDDIHKTRTGAHRFPPDCDTWVEVNPVK